jgi:hypothetical protein
MDSSEVLLDSKPIAGVAAASGLDGFAYAVMSSPFGLVGRRWLDVVSGSCGREEALRWLTVFPNKRRADESPLQPGASPPVESG